MGAETLGPGKRGRGKAARNEQAAKALSPEAEALLRRSEMRYRSFFELSGLSVWEEDISLLRAELARLRREGVDDVESYLEQHPEMVEVVAKMITVVDVNDTTLRMYGARSKEELLGPLSRTLRLDDPMGRRSLIDNIVAISRGTTYTQRESVVTRLDGEGLSVLINAYIPDEGDEYSHMLVSVVDISERKRAEERIRDLARLSDESPNPTIRVSLSGEIAYANSSAWPAVIALTGSDGKRLREERMAPLRRAWELGGRTSVELTAGDRFYLFAVVPVPIGGYINLYGRDVTDERALVDQVIRSQKMEAVGRLAAGVAHDFNNILTTIQGCSELIRDEIDSDSPLMRYANEIKLSTERAAALTRQLLSIGRGQLHQPRVLDVNELLHRIERTVARLVGEDIALLLRLAKEPWPIWADPAHLEQVTMSLAVNARDAMPRGGRLFLETRNLFLDEREARDHPELAPGEYVTLSFRDTGVGMDRETRSHLFEPFFTTKEAGAGTGLGLSTVKEIVEQSSGRIWVASTEGKGTVVTLCFPRYREGPSPSERAGSPSSS